MREIFIAVLLVVSMVPPSAGVDSAGVPLACRADAFTSEERARHAVLMEKLLSILHSRRELENGFAFTVHPAPENFTSVAEWITLERKCCPFLQFALEWGPETVTPELRLTGGPGVKEFIEAECAALVTEREGRGEP